MTKTEADPEIRDYTAMDNDIVGCLYNDEDLYRQFRVNPGKQASKSESNLLREALKKTTKVWFLSNMRCMTREIMTIGKFQDKHIAPPPLLRKCAIESVQ